MASFLVCPPDVPLNALTVRTTADSALAVPVAYDDLYPIDSTFYGERWGFAQTAANQTSVCITYDLGTGFTRTIDHFIVGGCQALRAAGVTQCLITGSNDAITWSGIYGTNSNFQTRTFMGPDGDDLMFTATLNDELAAFNNAYRYFQVRFSGGSAHRFPVSKIYFGNAFDAVAEPAMYDLQVLNERDSDTWKFPRGHVVMSKAFYAKHRFTIEWDGLSDALARTLDARLLSNPFRNHVFLYTGTYHDPLYDNRLVHARVLDQSCSVTRRKGSGDYVDVRAVFEEL